MAYAYYALNGEYPTDFSNPPTVEEPTLTCEGSFNPNVPCPCSSSSGSCSFPSSSPTSCSSNQQTFINNYLGSAETASSQTGLPVSFILGHWGLETAWGTSAGLPSCNNPGNLVVSGQPTCTTCGGCGVSSFSTLADGVDAYISAMNNKYAFVKWAYDNYGLEEAAKALGAGCEPASGYSSDIYATGRYNGVSCNGEAVDNNCYISSTASGNGQDYSVCAPVVSNDDCDGCNGCGYVGCSLYETITTSCLSPYNCVT
ncbi:glucosaminidase domain-containing protein [Alicyclobacillus sp. SP_1]|uniref:glucosaminidase domain-containing protein n=1 Tax=Alicyclobacillus sp. SP_1 TaxID=2942475 RepID=UPI0035BE2BCB